jgi:DNA-binding NarL/FixJ family response regulator
MDKIFKAKEDPSCLTNGVIPASFRDGCEWRDHAQPIPVGRSSAQTIDARELRALSSAKLIVLVDDRNLIRECVARCLLSIHEGSSVAMFATIADCAQADIDVAKVAFVLYNIHHRPPSDPEVEKTLERLGEMFATAPIILLSDSEDPDRVVEALERGARGYVPTSATIDIVIGAARLISAGGTFVPASSLMSLTPSAERSRSPMPLAGLFTHRQLAVLRLVRQGKANRTIARELAMSESTVKAHVRNVMQKLKATNRTQIVFLTQELFRTAACSP